MSLKFHHAGLSVPDLNASIAWWRDMLGFEIETRFAIPHGVADVAMLVKGDLHIELFEVAGAAALPEDRRTPNLDLRTHGNKHVAFEIEDLDLFLADMRAKNADVAMVVREKFGSGCFLRDCAGNLIEFVVKASPAIA